jgi:pyruvate/2-oxoglutarate dehydrogenase complex dihydrolipoamide acyltransferase (E2) component
MLIDMELNKFQIQNSLSMMKMKMEPSCKFLTRILKERIVNQQINMIPVNKFYAMVINIGQEKERLTLNNQNEVEFEKYLTLQIACNQELIDGMDVGRFCQDLNENIKILF